MYLIDLLFQSWKTIFRVRLLVSIGCRPTGEREKSKESGRVSRSVGGSLNKRVLQSASDKISRVRKQMAGPGGRAADTTQPP